MAEEYVSPLSTGRRVWFVIVVLLLAGFACNLTQSSDEEDATPVISSEVEEGTPQNTTPPTVQILTPQDGQQVIVGTPVDVRVNAQHEGVGIQRIQMKIDDRIVSSKSLLDNPRNVDVLLSWTPDQRGSYMLEVQAFQGSVGSEPVAVTLQVFPEGSILSNPAEGQPQQATPNPVTCNVRVLISNLNLRSGPGTSFNKLGSFDTGESVTVIGRNNDDRSREWYKIRRSSGTEAWVINNSDWLETSGNCESVPTVN
jgi:hypothetical protein